MLIKKIIAILVLFAFLFQNLSFGIIIGEKGLILQKPTTLNDNSILDQYRYIFQQINQGSTDKLFDLNSGLKLYSNNLKSVNGYTVNFTGIANYNLLKAKSIYDANIAILDSKADARLTYETPYFCDLLISSLAKFTKIGNNVCLSSYDAFSGAYASDSDRTYVSIINDYEFENADLSRFGVIIFPDFSLGAETKILDDLGIGGVEKLKNYIENGGIIIFSAKSILLAQKIGLLEDGIVDDKVLVKHHTNQGKVLLEKTNDFNTNVLNYSLFKGKNYDQANLGTGSYYEYLLGTYFINDVPSLHKVRYFDIKNDSNYYFQDVESSEDIDIDTDKVIASFYKKYGKGLIIYNGGNSIYSSWKNSHVLYVNHILNSILLSFLRQIYTETKVVQKSNPILKENLIPALEKNVMFEYDFKGVNTFDKDTKDLELKISYVDGLKVSNLPSECNLNEGNKQIICEKDILEKQKTWNIKFNLEIVEPTFSQKGKDIVVTNTVFTYKDASGKNIYQNIGVQTVDALGSVNMRGDLNIDPSSYYPLPGKGVFIDQVIAAENKSETEGLDVDYSTTIPLISPIFDENDQEKLVIKLDFPKDYYNDLYNKDTKTGIYPFKNNGECEVSGLDLNIRCKDFYIPALFGTKYDGNPIKVDNYDEPVYRVRSYDEEAYDNLDKSKFDINDLGTGIIKQIFLPDADKLLMHARPRKMIFIYPKKKEVLFAHQDIYFYDNPSFVLPNGITDRKSFITIDKYSNKYGLVCDGNKNTINKKGSYEYPTGIIESEYSNYLKCNRGESKAYTWDNLPEGVEKTYYLYPISEKNNINDYTDLVGFDASGNFIGYDNNSKTRNSGAYPIKFIKGAYSNFYIPKNSSLKGGYFEFDFPDTVDVSKIQKVYMLADHIAVNKIVRNGKNVKIYFYRGKMPNEQTLKSEFGLGVEGLNQNITGVDFKIYSLTYDLTSSGNNQKYTFEQSFKIDFHKQNFFKLPAVKLKFTLPRRKRILKSDIEDLNIPEEKLPIIFDTVEWSDKVLVFKSTNKSTISSKIDQAGLTGEVKSKLLNLFDKTSKESYVRKYEHLEPFVRFGVYIQELLHRTVWGSAEIHPISDPGVVVDSPAFGTVFNVGTSPIPFREYLKTGKTQVIPLGEESSRIDYKDLFNRQFAQPVRTTIPEAVPLPPPLRNFIINTTYEVYDKDGNLKTNWDGETELEIRQNIKLYNNYPKFFDPTICKDNFSTDRKRYGLCYDGTMSGTYKLLDQELTDTDFYYISGVRLFNNRKDYEKFMSGLNERIEKDKEDGKIPDDYKVKFLTKATKDNINLSDGEFVDDKARNYSPEVANFYPKNYIKSNMWNLTHYDYSDSPYEKGYPFHMDNHIPNPSETINQPHNIIAIPFYKGFGYNIKYFKENKSFGQVIKQNDGKVEHNITPYSSWKYNGKIGWWSENLQNRDDTTLAGNEKVNTVPYKYNSGTNEYLNTSNIDETYFESVDKSTIKNIYTCLFNPKKLKDSQDKYVYKKNVVLNNVIPLIPWITKSDKLSSNQQNYLDNYTCSALSKEYDNSNLYKVNNIAETEKSYRLYFGANLRGGAKEGINIISRLQKYPGRNYEEDVKVVEGGRFVYRNPANGPNSFLVVDNPVQVIKSVRSDLKLEKEVIPYTVKDYKTDVYLLYKLTDPTEIFIDSNGEKIPRRWNYEVYTDSRGFGNYSSTIYVGNSYNKLGVKSSLLKPGDDTVVKIDLFNNAGFDWEMIGSGEVVNDNGQYKTLIRGGIDFEIVGKKPLNANDLINKVARNVVKPIKYNFLNIELPNELKDYVEIVPSDTDIETPGTFFDFDNVNVTTIRDGFKGTYFLKLKVKDNIPDNLRGRVFNIKLSLNPKYFKHLPGIENKDPVNWPYKLELPDIRFAIANSKGEAYYINGQSKNINLSINLSTGYTLDSIYKIDEEGLNKLRNAAGNGTKKHQKLREAFESFSGNYETIKSNLEHNSDKDILKISLDENGIPLYPYFKNTTGELTKDDIENNLMFLVHLKRENLKDGEHTVEINSTVNFRNSAGVERSHYSNLLKDGKSIPNASVKIFAQGPKLTIHYKSALVGNDKNDELEIQKLVSGENIIMTKIFLKNIGSDVAFDPTIKINVSSGIKVNTEYTNIEDHPDVIQYSGDQIIVKNLYTEDGKLSSEGEAVGPGITNYIPIYLIYTGSYQDVPKKLIDSVEYEFTPFDEILPSKKGIDENGFSLDFVKTSFDVKKTGLDKYTLYGSGNSLGIYWDFDVDNKLLTGKQNSIDSELLVKDVYLDPTIDHTFVARSYFKTKKGDFSLLSTKSITLPAEPVSLNHNSTQVKDSKKYEIVWKTNKLGKYAGTYDYTLIQTGLVYTGLSSIIPNNGTIKVIIDNIDVTKDSKFYINLYNSGTLIKTGVIDIKGQEAKIYSQVAKRTADGQAIKISFKTNKILNHCFKIYSLTSNKYISGECINVENEKNSFIDNISDVFKANKYKIELFDKSNLSNPDLTSIVDYLPDSVKKVGTPAKIFYRTVYTGDIVFEAVKDLKRDYLIDGTKVRYVVLLKNALSGSKIVQKTDNNKVKVYYSTGYLYAANGWGKKLVKPEILLKDNVPSKEGYDSYGGVVIGAAVPIVTDNQNIVEINGVWEKPDVVELIHANDIIPLSPCNNENKMCFTYINSTLTVYTNKFSKVVYYKRHNISSSSGGGGGGYFLQKDYCPNGDYSPSYYDNDCGKPKIIKKQDTKTNEKISTKKLTKQTKARDLKKIRKILKTKLEKLGLYLNSKESDFNKLVDVINDYLAKKITKKQLIDAFKQYILLIKKEKEAYETNIYVKKIKGLEFTINTQHKYLKYEKMFENFFNKAKQKILNNSKYWNEDYYLYLKSFVMYTEWVFVDLEDRNFENIKSYVGGFKKIVKKLKNL